jgi:uncharacterized protein YcbK (DUF882 family)
MLVELDAKMSRLYATHGIRWPGLWVYSGFRTKEEQADVNPFAPNSKHTKCPAMAVDLRVGDLPASTTDPVIWTRIGQEWQFMGGRWGGVWTPPDWNHFDI